MKSLFIIDEHISSKYTGVGTFIETIMPCLKSIGIHLNLISYNDDTPDFRIDNYEDHTVYRIPQHGGAFLINALPSLTLLRLYVKDSPDNVFWISYCPSNIYLKFLKSFFPKSKRVTLIHNQLWTNPLLGDANLYKKIVALKKVQGKNAGLYKQIRKHKQAEQRMYSLSHHVVCLSNSTYHLLQDVYQVPKEKISMISNGIDTSCFENTNIQRDSLRHELGINPGEKVILFSGRVVKEKGIYHLLDAFETLWKENHELRLIVAGITESFESYPPHIPESISHVTFTGLMPKDKVYKWYKAADIGVLPSFTEQCSYTGIEMMASRLLIVTTNGNGNCDMFDEKYAVIVDAREETMSADLTEALRKALAIDDTEKERMVELAYHKVMNEYSLRHMQDRYSEMLENLFKAQ